MLKLSEGEEKNNDEGEGREAIDEITPVFFVLSDEDFFF